MGSTDYHSVTGTRPKRSMIATRLRHHALLFGIAVGLIALAYAIALATNVTRFALPNAAVSAAMVVGAIAVVLSLPLVGLAALSLIRPKVWTAWPKGTTEARIGVIAYIAISAAEA